MRYADAPVLFDVYKPRRPVERSTTAAEEIRATIAWLGDAGCCAVPAPPRSSGRALALSDVTLEDQDGARTAFGAFFSGKPSVVAFFYSRCDNVRKCSLTVTKLAALQRALAARGLAGRVRLSAITYDPGFDLPARLALYGRERGVTFGEDARFFRVPSGFEEVRSAFDLGVNYAGAIVNRHRIELYVLDRRGRIAASFTHLTWSDDEVVERLERLLRAPSWLDLARALPAGAASVLIVLLPKCPLCLWAYASALGVTGLQLAPHRAWLLPAAIVLVLTHLLMMGRRAARARRRLPLCVSAAGTLALIAGTIVWELPLLSAAGAAATIAGAVMNAMPQGVDAGTVKPTTRRIMPSLFVRT
jgi:protein SCO1/2